MAQAQAKEKVGPEPKRRPEGQPVITTETRTFTGPDGRTHTVTETRINGRWPTRLALTNPY